MRTLMVLLAALVLSLPVQAESNSFEDAALRSVFFVEEQQGWAVGDDGAIWHTIDGGKNWERHPFRIRASLRSVYFLNPFIGWIAGREELPGGGSAGVVLYTRDGGVQWRRILVNSLPGLHLVKFVDGRTGYLVGDGSEQFPSGVFSTTDGGKTWQPVAGPRATSWNCADFNAEGGALGGAWNRLATIRRAQVHSIEMDSLGGRALCGLQLRGDDAFAVGQGGLLLHSRKTRGSTWEYGKIDLPPEVREQWDFHAVHGVGEHLWVVGRPGSVALHSPDLGKTWKVVKLGQSMPLHAVYFHDERRGWAVGELGTVLATTDGGQSWQIQRQGGKRLAALYVHARPTEVALDTITRLGADDGYLTGNLNLTAPEAASAALSRVSEQHRFIAAVRQAGGAIAESLWQFPVSTHLARADRDQLIATWNKCHGGSAPRHLLAQLVLALRMYRPEVVLTDGPGDACQLLTREAITEAFRLASDENAFPEQLIHFGLKPHQPQKLYSLAMNEPEPRIRIDLTSIRPRLGGTIREFSSAPLAMLGQSQAPAERYWKLLAWHRPDAEKDRDLMQGVAFPAGGDARRVMTELAEVTQEELKAARARANLWAIADAPASELTSPERLLAQIGPTIADMPAEAGARVAHGLAWQYARKGQWALAREAFMLLVQRYPTHALAIDGYRWLLQHQASSEARRRHEMGQFLLVGSFEHGVPSATAQPSSRDRKPKVDSADKINRQLGEVPSFDSRSRRELSYLGGAEAMRKWHQGALALEEKLSAFGPLYSGDPAMQFAVQSSRRQLGDVQTALEWYRQFAMNQPDGPWRKAALAELWLTNRVGPPPKPVLSVRSCEQRPYLDGKLDDLCWQQAKSVKLLNAVGDTAKQYPTEVRISHDQDFLYVGIVCSHPEGAEATPAKVRLRDQDMRNRDRVSVMFDLDRDYGTCFHFQIDATGCVAEDCWGDKTWDPKWFVAVWHEPTRWTVEAAIPRVALTSDHLIPNKAWATNIVRVLPGQGVQAFSTPAEAPEEAMRLEGMGLLLFIRDVEQAATPKKPVEVSDR